MPLGIRIHGNGQATLVDDDGKAIADGRLVAAVDPAVFDAMRGEHLVPLQFLGEKASN